jgi:hypothetical protein
MYSPLSFQVTSQYVDGELRFDLPVRPLGPLRWIGLVLIAFGIAFMWGPGHDLVGSLQGLRDGFKVGDLLFTIFEALFVCAGLVPVGIGVFVIAGRTRIAWSPEGLRSTEILGPLRWTRRMPREPVRRLAVSGATSAATATTPRREFDGFAILAAEFADGSKKLLAIGYPKALLLQIAEQLRSYVGGGAGSMGGAPVEVVEETGDESERDEFLEQPADSNIRIEEHGTDLRLVVPPAGVVKGSSGLFGFAIIWSVIIGLVSAAFVYGQWSGRDDMPWYVWLILLGFWAVGGAFFVAALNMGRRTASITVARGQLVVETRSLFRGKRNEWAAGELVAVRVGGSGMEMNDEPVLELQIYSANGKKEGMLAGRDDEELRWMASRLRRALRL